MYLRVLLISIAILGSAFGKESIINNIQVNSSKIPKYELFEITFDVTREYENPFDPKIVNVAGDFKGPNSVVEEIPGFYYQEYRRTLVAEYEMVSPINKAQWKIRFAPKEVGIYKYQIVIEDSQGRYLSEVKTFEVIQSDNPGFIKVSKKDNKYFEFDNGEFYYPIGHDICWPGIEPGYYKNEISTNLYMGTFAYDRYFEKMSFNGENWTTIWMVPKWLGLEWNDKADGYRGLGKYNLKNAWRLDQILEKAHERGIYINLILDQFQQLYKDGKWWEDSPYNTKNGGKFEYPEQYFMYVKPHDLYKQKMRYVISRWGYSTNIMMFTAFDELDLVDSYRKVADYYTEHKNDDMRYLIKWFQEAIDYMKSIDPWKHVISVHFSSVLHDKYFWNEKQFEVVTNNAYEKVQLLGKGFVETVNNYYKKTGIYNKPTFIAEFGTDWKDDSTKPSLTSLHNTSWMQFVTNLAGVTGYWWWNLVDQKDLGYHYKAIANYSMDEDRRGFGFEQIHPIVSHATEERLDAYGLASKDIVYLWVYNKDILKSNIKEIEKVNSGGRITLENLEVGQYIVEYWDTYEGEVKYTLMKEMKPFGKIEIVLPVIEKDMACKIKNVNRIKDKLPSIFSNESDLLEKPKVMTQAQKEEVQKYLEIIEKYLENYERDLARTQYEYLKKNYNDPDIEYVNAPLYKKIKKLFRPK